MAVGLATFQELVMGDASLPVGVEDGCKDDASSRTLSFVISNRPETHSQIMGRIS